MSRDTAREIAELWAAVLGLPEANADESFIGLGGDSIAASLCLNRLYTCYGCEVSFGVLLEPDMTARRLALLVERALETGATAVSLAENISG